MNCVFHVLWQVGAKRKNIQTTHVYLKQCHLPLDGKRSPRQNKKCPKKDDESMTWPPLSSPKTSLNIIAVCPQIEAPTTHNPPMALERNAALSSIFAGFSSPTIFGSRVEVGFGTCGSFGLWASRPFVGAMTTAPLVALHTDYSILVCVVWCGVTLLLWLFIVDVIFHIAHPFMFNNVRTTYWTSVSKTCNPKKDKISNSDTH